MAVHATLGLAARPGRDDAAPRRAAATAPSRCGGGCCRRRRPRRRWGLWPVHDMAGALGVSLLGPGWLVARLAVIPAWPGCRRGPGAGCWRRTRRRPRRCASPQLTATRAAALDAHATELRRIERSLHDGTQNRLVAVNVLLGAARRAVARDPAAADAILERAQDAAEQALAELRAVVRSILPPVLTDREPRRRAHRPGRDCPVPCRVDADVPAGAPPRSRRRPTSWWPRH